MRFARFLIVLVLCGCSRAETDPVVRVEADDPLMVQAISEARDTVDEFVEALQTRAPTDSDFSVKAPVRDGSEVEHFWLVEVSYQAGNFAGLIGNTPQAVTTVQEGQPYSISAADISDWMFFRNGKAVGARTLRAMFPRLPAEEVAALKQQLGWQ